MCKTIHHGLHRIHSCINKIGSGGSWPYWSTVQTRDGLPLKSCLVGEGPVGRNWGFFQIGGVAGFDFLDFSLVFCTSFLREEFYRYITLSIFGVGVGVACTVQDALGFGFVWEGLGRLAAVEQSRWHGVFYRHFDLGQLTLHLTHFGLSTGCSFRILRDGPHN